MNKKPPLCQVRFDKDKVKTNKYRVKLNFTKDMKETFGKWLAELRESRRMNQRELAKLSKVSNTTISLLEADKISQPRFKSLDKIGKALGVSPDEIRTAFSERQLSKGVIPEHSVKIGRGVLLVFPEKCNVTETEKQNLILVNQLLINGLLAHRLIAAHPEQIKNFIPPPRRELEPVEGEIVNMTIPFDGDINTDNGDGEEKTKGKISRRSHS